MSSSNNLFPQFAATLVMTVRIGEVREAKGVKIYSIPLNFQESAPDKQAKDRDEATMWVTAFHRGGDDYLAKQPFKKGDVVSLALSIEHNPNEVWERTYEGKDGDVTVEMPALQFSVQSITYPPRNTGGERGASATVERDSSGMSLRERQAAKRAAKKSEVAAAINE
jgi:hypothetical protein